MQALSVLNAAMVPAALIGACGLLLLGVYNKYSKIVASLRSLAAEQRSLLRAGAQSPTLENESRQGQIVAETLLLRRRLGYTLRQIQFITGAGSLFLISSLVIAAGTAAHVSVSGAAAVLVCAGLAALLGAMTQGLVEAKVIWQVVEAEINAAAPAQDKTTLGSVT